MSVNLFPFSPSFSLHCAVEHIAFSLLSSLVYVIQLALTLVFLVHIIYSIKNTLRVLILMYPTYFGENQVIHTVQLIFILLIRATPGAMLAKVQEIDGFGVA